MAPSGVSDQKYAALYAAPPFGKLFAISLMLSSAAFLVQNKHWPQGHAQATLVAPPPVALIDASRPPSFQKNAVPTVFQQEAAMSPAQLMTRWEPLIAAAAKRFHVPAAWIRNVMRAESGGRTMMAEGKPIVSDQGAMGLMQLLPGTYAEMRVQYGLGADPFDPHDNVFAGAAYLRWLKYKYGFPAMFAAYNDGPGHLEDHLYRGRALPAETRAYVAGITRALGKGGEWLARGDRITVTRPDGSKLALERSRIRAVRAPLPGEYPAGVAAVIEMGKTRQGVKESADALLAQLAPPRRRGA